MSATAIPLPGTPRAAQRAPRLARPAAGSGSGPSSRLGPSSSARSGVRPSGPAQPGLHTVARKLDGNAKPPSAQTDQEILFQKFFKSVGPRTYAAQVKRARNGNHFLVLTEGRRDEKTGDVRKARAFVYSEDFVEFFRLVKSAAEFIKENPVPPEVKRRQEQFWAKRQRQVQPS